MTNKSVASLTLEILLIVIPMIDLVLGILGINFSKIAITNVGIVIQIVILLFFLLIIL